MLYPLIIQTLANEQLEESRRHAERVRRLRQAREENLPPPHAPKGPRHLRLVLGRGAGYTPAAGTGRSGGVRRRAARARESGPHAANATPSSANASGSISLTCPFARNGRKYQ